MKKEEGGKFFANPVMAHERRKVVLLFNHLDMESRDKIKERIKQIAKRYDPLQGILLHIMPIKAQAEALGQDCDMLEFSRPLFKFCTSYYAPPEYQGNVYESLATLARNAHVYVIGSSTLEIDKYVAAIVQYNTSIIHMPLEEVNELGFSMVFAKELSQKRSGEIYDKAISLFEGHNISFGGGNSTTNITGSIYCLDNSLTVDEMKTMLQTFVDAEKEITITFN